MGKWTESWVSSKRPEVSAVCGGTVGAAPNRERTGEIRKGNKLCCRIKDLVFMLCEKCVDSSLMSPEQQLKKNKQTEEDMLYGTTVRTPTKRRFLGTTTPNKSRKVVNSLCALLLWCTVNKTVTHVGGFRYFLVCLSVSVFQFMLKGTNNVWNMNRTGSDLWSLFKTVF